MRVSRNFDDRKRAARRKIHSVALPAVLCLVASVCGQVPSVATRVQAGYAMADGSVRIITSARMAGVVRAIDKVYEAKHPGVRFTVREGDNYSAMAALTFDRSVVAPLGAEFTRVGLGDNLKIASEPIGIRIAHATLTPGSGVSALGVIVNRANPIATITMSQLTRMLAVGGPGGDIATWGQAGVTGALADREVHPVGPLQSDERDSEDPQAGEFLSAVKMGGLNMNHRYVAMGRTSDVVERVKEDRAAIGIVALNVPLGEVRVIAVKTETGMASAGSATDIAAGRYALDRYVYLYVRVGKGMPVDAFAKEYVRVALSEEGQAAIAADSAGYIPLNAAELADERTKLDR